MKLLCVAPYYYPKTGGLENYAHTVNKGLVAKHGWEVHVATTHHDRSLPVEGTVNGVVIHRLPAWFKLSNTPINPFWYFQISRLVKKIRPDVINGHTPVPFIADIAAMVAHKHRIPYFLTYQNDPVKGSVMIDFLLKLYFRLVARITFTISRKIIVTTRYYFEHRSFISDFRKKLTVIPPGIDPKSIADKAIKKRGGYFVFVSQLDRTHAHKGLPVLLQAMAQLTREYPDIKLKIVGTGNAVPEIQKIIMHFGLNQNVELTGYLSDLELKKCYRHAIANIVPSTTASEGFGLTILEAASQGTPSIASNIGGIPYITNWKFTGKLISPGQIDELTKAITTLSHDSTLLYKLGQKAIEMVKTYYRYPDNIELINRIIRRNI